MSALLTPPAMELIAMLSLPAWPFSRVFDRVAMVVILALLLLFRRYISFGFLKEALRQGNAKSRVKEILLGLCFSLLPVLPVVAFLVYDGALEFGSSSSRPLWMRMLKAGSAGLLISLIEESFFRVLLYTRLKESFRLITATVICCLCYAFAHFITPVKSFIYGPGYQWDAGLIYLWEVSRRLLEPGLVPAFTGLFMVGLVLCFTIHRTRRFYLCVGLHTGWVMALKGTKYTTRFAEGVSVPAGAGERYFLVSHPEAWIAIAVTFALVFIYSRSINRGKLV